MTTATTCWVLAGLLGVQAPSEVATGPVGRRLPAVDLGDPAELLAPATPAATAAQRLADGGRYDASAQAFEALWREHGDARALYQAGAMRTRAGQNAVAVRHFQLWLERASGVSEATRRYVNDRLAIARAQLVGVRVAAVEGSGRPVALTQAELRIEPVTGAAGDPGRGIQLANYAGVEVLLDRAPVVVHLAIPGFAPVSQLHSPGDGATTWTLKVARQRVTVDLRFVPEKLVRGATLRLSPIDGASAPPIEQRLESPGLTMPLTTGIWQADVTAARRREAHRSFTVTPGMGTVVVQLERPARGGDGGGDARSFSKGEATAVVLGGGFVATTVTGLALVLAGSIKETRARRRNDEAIRGALVATADGDHGEATLDRVEQAYSTARLHLDIDRAFNLQVAGGVVALSGLGALLTAAAVAGRVKRNAAYLEMGVGALLAGAGAGWMVYAIGRQDDLLAPSDPVERRTWSDLRPVSGHRAGATVMLGLGAGLVVFPALALIGDTAVKRRMKRRGLALTPSLAGDRAVVTLRGQF